MCGIAGFVQSNRQFDKGSLEQMLQLLKHRGPDAQGTHVDERSQVYLGHRRLSIIDLSPLGNQPMHNEDQSVSVVFNGEIYNYQELKKDLVQKGHQFRSNTDTEVIIHAWEEYGEQSFQKFNGMFAIVLWDVKKQQLVFVRDRIGIKPLYYLKKSGLLAWSSETKAFQALGSLSVSMDSIQTILGFQYLPNNEQTTFHDVYKIPPGQYMVYDIATQHCEMREFWKLCIQEEVRQLPFEKALQELEKLLISSIQYRLIADVPVGIMLSGGLDSSVIAALAQRHHTQTIRTFTAGFDDRIDERPFARQVAAAIGSQHEEIIIDLDTVMDTVEEYVWLFDDLNSFDGGLLTNYVIAKKIRERGVKVILLGEGSDEIFGGYSWFGLSRLPFSFVPRQLTDYLYYYSTSRNLGFSPLQYYKAIHQLFLKVQPIAQEKFDRISAYEIQYQLPNNYLMKVDKGTMGQSIEARVPYLDYRLVEFAYSLPSQYKIHGKWHSFRECHEKYILRKLAEKYLPKEIAWRKKKGGMLPIATIVRRNAERIREVVLASGSLSTEIFSRKKIEKLFQGDFERLGNSNWSFGEVQREMFLWKLFILETWHQLYGKQ